MGIYIASPRSGPVYVGETGRPGCDGSAVIVGGSVAGDGDHLALRFLSAYRRCVDVFPSFLGRPGPPLNSTSGGKTRFGVGHSVRHVGHRSTDIFHPLPLAKYF